MKINKNDRKMSNIRENEGNTTPEISEDQKVLNDLTSTDYKWGFVTDIESETVPKGLNEEIVPDDFQKER